jgi:hypothetical protein
MKKSLLTAMALGALAMSNLKAQTWNVPTNASSVGTTTYLGTTGTGTSPLKIASNSTDIQFFTGAIGTTANERLRIAANGNVGIGTGTTAPQAKLHVAGSLKATGTGYFYPPSTNPYPLLLETYTSQNMIEFQTWEDQWDMGLTDISLGGGGPVKFFIRSSNTFSINNNGNIGLGIATPLTPLHVTGQTIIGDLTQTQLNTANAAGINYKLLVSGGILTEKLKVAPKANGADWSWPDYVFSKSYKLNSLDSVETFINKNSHLPDVPSAKEIGTNGFDVAEMDAKLLRKVEELTLYVIEISKKEKENKEEVAILKRKIEALESENNELKK